MKIYLVGGAVRDLLLGITPKERDWLVVGSTIEEMLKNGYKKVGKDFPVFLHPQSNEEYALARTEKKVGRGYYGFVCDFNNKVTIEEDLARRDLTINAMAKGVSGRLIDPYNGKGDLDNKILRHVSDSFVEDPLRVLRVARFAARYYHLGFTVADETISLMRKMVQSRELGFLTIERIWLELQKSLSSDNPEIFICVLRQCGALKELFPELDKLFGIPASIDHHPEIDTGVHSLMVLHKVAKLSIDLEVRFGALLHDLGKGVVPMQCWPSQINHDTLGCLVIEKLCNRLKVPVKYKRLAALASKVHIMLHRVYELSSDEIVNVLEMVDAFRRPEILRKLLIIAEADSLGRGFYGRYPNIPWYFTSKQEQTCNYKQREYWQFILSVCNKIDIQDILDSGLNGEEIKLQIRNRRIKCIDEVRKNEF